MLRFRYGGVALAAFVALALNATPARAVGVSADSSTAAFCAISTTRWECTTGAVSADSSTHLVWFRVAPVLKTICEPRGVDYRLWDIDTGVTIGYGNVHQETVSETIGGLYGRYRLRLQGTCYANGFLRDYTP